MVGAVVVRDGAIVGEGYHARYGEPHAEVAALRAAGDLTRGATVYISLEPCAHYGKTPPCVDALIAAGVARVVIATRDPNPEAAGGLDRLRAAGIAVLTGIEEEHARELNAAFFHAFMSRLPWVTLKLAVSLDGAIADAAGHSQWITGPRSRRVVHHLRAGSDAIGVGLGTLLADDPSLTVRDVPVPRVPPRRVIFDRHGRTPLDARVVRTAREVPTIIVAESPDPARARALESAGVQIVAAPTTERALEQLAHEGIRSLMVEGGARLAGTLLEHALVHRLIIFQAPVLLGAGALGAFAHAPAMAIGDAPRLRVVGRRALGDDTMTVYALTGD
jgi:diaminohydroxyphosphoribosylaminopyrimidine deaminase/5-amino-6-(5-phosphoribosylamino)uracil reductase